MRWFDPRSWSPRSASRQVATPRAQSATAMQDFNGFDDPAFLEWVRGNGGRGGAGLAVTPEEALFNMTVLRCLSLISFSIGMLPLQLREKETKAKASNHPLYRVLHKRPNNWMTPFEFRSYMQQQALTEGDAFALKVQSGGKVLQLVPIVYQAKRVKLTQDLRVSYEFQMPNGAWRTFDGSEIFHLRYGLSRDTVTGVSLVKQSADAIGLAQEGELAAGKVFKNGMIVGGTLTAQGKLSPEVYERLKQSLAERAGAENAGKDMLLEEGLKWEPKGTSPRDSQNIENRKFQIEEIARPFGVPRPLLGLDDTSWGSGIGVLGQFFVRYGLNPWFTAWEQAITRDCLSDADEEIYEPKFNASGLLRGSETEQGEFFAKALGAGGHAPWMHPAEVREIMDLPERDDLPAAPGQQANGGTE